MEKTEKTGQVPISEPRKTKSLEKSHALRSTKLTRSSSTPLDSKPPRKRANSTTEKNNHDTQITTSNNHNNTNSFFQTMMHSATSSTLNKLQSSTNFLTNHNFTNRNFLAQLNIPKFSLQTPSFKNFEIKNSYTKTISLLKNQQCVITLPSIYNKKIIKQAIFDGLEGTPFQN